MLGRTFVGTIREIIMQSVDDIAGKITERAIGKRLVVFVCGFGGAGKTTLCHQLATKLLLPTIIFETDWYAKYATQERRQRIASAIASQDSHLIEQEENPKNWYDWPALAAGLHSLKDKGYLKIRDGWSQRTGEKDLFVDLDLPKGKDSVIICDGIYLLHDEVRSAADLILFLDTPVTACVERTAARDSHRSSKVYLNYKAALVDKYDRLYFELYRKNADAIVSLETKID
jgi:uridine kinase